MLNERAESKSAYTVIHDFIASKVNAEEGYASEEHTIRKGTPIFADPQCWRGRLWEGQEVVQFFCAGSDTRLYVGRKTFKKSTKKATHGT
jgi:hypothetical protein